jgi:hypothetical protein
MARLLHPLSSFQMPQIIIGDKKFTNVTNGGNENSSKGSGSTTSTSSSFPRDSDSNNDRKSVIWQPDDGKWFVISSIAVSCIF